MRQFPVISTSILLGTALSACFTGIESTPRIDESQVLVHQAAHQTPEQRLMDSLFLEQPSQWAVGKKFLIARDRVSLIFTPASDNTDKLGGHTMTYQGIKSTGSLTRDDAVELCFTSDDGRRLFYRPINMDRERFDSLSSLEIPYAIDLATVQRCDKLLRGREVYIRTPHWYSLGDSEPINGLRHIRVRIDSLVPGNENFPVAVCFTTTDDQSSAQAAKLLMSTRKYNATRTFDELFAFDNPRKRFPEIKDSTWNMIVRSRVEKGMTRDECRLALGQPGIVERIPTRGGMAERWSYPEGIYLFFEDGFLSDFRL